MKGWLPFKDFLSSTKSYIVWEDDEEDILQRQQLAEYQQRREDELRRRTEVFYARWQKAMDYWKAINAQKELQN
jgi:hypothetical protein